MREVSNLVRNGTFKYALWNLRIGSYLWLPKAVYSTHLCNGLVEFKLKKQPPLATRSNYNKPLTQEFMQSSILLNKKYSSCKKFDTVNFEHISEETLQSLCEKLEELLEEDCAPVDSDITYSSGVLKISLGAHGTYVINKQTPNQQIWLSSPVSGPKRYDFINNSWLYKHDGTYLHSLLGQELSIVFKKPIDLTKCDYGKTDRV